MIKYLAKSAYTLALSRVEVIRETAKCVFVASNYRFDKNGERKNLKASSGYRYFDTFDEAKNHLLAIGERRVTERKNYLKSGEDDLRAIQEMEEPK